MAKHRSCVLVFAVAALVAVASGCNREKSAPSPPSPAVQLPEGKGFTQEELARAVQSAPSKMMSQSGLVGAMGGARVKLVKAGTHEVLLPLPQLADGQAPVCYYIRSTPSDALIEHRLRKRDDTNVVVSVRLKGENNQEIQIEWCSVVLVGSKAFAPNRTPSNEYVVATACVQSEAKALTDLGAKLWPKSGKVADYAVNIQKFVGEMKKASQPRSLDALGILDSGFNGICTANANLAAALLRSRGIASRSMAVIPPISQRLEMHRIVEYFHEGQWHSFDPSSLHTDVSMKPWQQIIMAKTTIEDENLAMKPRMSAMAGCPYAQELELASDDIILWGQDFFWTIAKPLAEFDVAEEAMVGATDAWRRYLDKGVLSQGQIKAATAKSAKDFSELIRSE